MKTIAAFLAIAVASFAPIAANTVINMDEFGIRPDRKENMTPKLTQALKTISQRYPTGALTLLFAPGIYNFHPKGATETSLYISNHDQDNPKQVAFMIDGRDSLTVEGCGADFIFHGRMLPVVVRNAVGVELRDFHIDFAQPHITQVEILKSDTISGITFKTEPWTDTYVAKSGKFTARGEGWTLAPRSGIAFEANTRHVVYRTSDLWCPLDSVITEGKNVYRAPRWRNTRLKTGMKVALRGWGRPTPGIFLTECRNPKLTNVKIHYAEGMGLLAQLCDSVTLSGFGVCLRSNDDPRYFTTQADATHFSGCKGLISSTDGLYEGMMDDAINVHGTYLKVTGRRDECTLTARYMHSQSYGFGWGYTGDSVSIISAPTMDPLPGVYSIRSIEPLDEPFEEWLIRFDTPLPDGVGTDSIPYGLENLTMSPEVYFARNVIRNNRARGSLFSTPRRTIVEDNLFDHTSGTAILLCGDCMGWYETGACHDVTIRRNRFVNSLTNLFQFTEAVISIYPEIHYLNRQQRYFHSGILIENNDFSTFDAPILYAKSVDGLTFRGNRITLNHDYVPFHSNRYTFKLERTRNVEIIENNYGEIEPSFYSE